MNETRRVTLIRYHQYSQGAILDPGTLELETFDRQLNREGPPYWLPEISVYGYFDVLGGTAVALYREASDPGDLWLQLADRRFRIENGVTSRFFPPLLPDSEPSLANADVLRRFELSVAGSVVATLEYSLRDGEKRLADSADPFPAWPVEEDDYDLLLLAHGIITRGAWPQVLLTPLRA